VPAFRADARCQVVAICPRTLDHAARVAEQLRVPQAYGDVRQMLASGQMDAVSIAVPPALQPELVVAAAEAGKHVFCEKPLAADVPAAERALAAAEKSGVAHAVDFLFPEIPAWQQARSLLAAGTLGALRHAAVSWRVESYAFARGLDSWKMRSPEGGGTLNNFVSHSLYYLEWLLGPVTRIAARFTPRQAAGEARVDDGLEHVEIDRLGHVIIGPELASLEFVVAVGQRGQEHEGHVAEPRGKRRQSLQQLEAGHHRHADVGQHEVGFRPENRRKALPAVMGDMDLVAPFHQLFGDQSGGVAVVFDTEDFLARF